MLNFDDLKNYSKGDNFFENIDGNCIRMTIISDILFTPTDRTAITDYIRFRCLSEKGDVESYTVWNGMRYYGLFRERHTGRPLDWSHKHINNPAIL